MAFRRIRSARLLRERGCRAASREAGITARGAGKESEGARRNPVDRPAGRGRQSDRRFRNARRREVGSPGDRFRRADRASASLPTVPSTAMTRGTTGVLSGARRGDDQPVVSHIQRYPGRPVSGTDSPFPDTCSWWTEVVLASGGRYNCLVYNEMKCRSVAGRRGGRLARSLPMVGRGCRLFPPSPAGKRG